MNRKYRLKTALIPIAMLLMMFFSAWLGIAQNTAVFPDAVATTSDLPIATNSYSSALVSGITSSATSATVMSGSGLTAPALVTIDSEIMAVCQVNGNTLTFGRTSCPNIDGRGFDGTAAASHLASRAVQGRVTAWAVNQLNAEVLAVEASTTIAVNAKAYGAKGDDSTNDTTAIQNAISAAVTAGRPVYLPKANYRVCGISYSGSGNVNIFGDGMQKSMLKPYGSCSTMLTITTTGAVTLHDFGTDMEYTGHSLSSSQNIYITGPGTTNNLTPPSRVTLYNLYTARAKSVGIQCAPCQNVSYTNSVSYKNYFFGAAFSSSGTVSSPLYSKGFNIHGILSIDESIGVGMNFFLSDMSISGNVFIQSNLSLVQTPQAQAVIEANVFDGVPDNGCYFDGTCGTIAGSWNALFLEGVGYVTVGKNYFSNVNGSQGVIYAPASNLTIGTDMALPTNNLTIDGNDIQNSSAGLSITVTTQSTTFGGTAAAAGGNIRIENNKMSHVNQCPTLSSATSFTFSGNSCEWASNGGYSIGSSQNGTVRGNWAHNVRTSGGTTYTTGTVSGSSGSASITGSGTTFVSGMVGGSFTAAGTAYQICSRASNTSIALCTPLVTALSGSSYSIYYGAPTSGAGITFTGNPYNIYVAANSIKNDSGATLAYGINDSSGLTPAQSAITYDGTNSCSPSSSCTGGIYNPAPTTTPTLTSCGTSPSMGVGSTNQSGQFVPGSGSPTACTITFAGSGFNIPGGTSGPVCSFTPASSSFVIYQAGASATAYTINSSAAMSGLIQYQCAAPQGQADRGKYPWPYFWQ